MARPTQSTTLLVLRKTKLGETDLIITGLSEEGSQIRAVAKGARKPGSRLGASMELYSVTRVLLHKGRNLDTVTEARPLVPNQAARRDVFHSAGAAIIVEFLEKATRDGMDEPRLFPLSVEAIRCVGAVGEEGIALICAAALLKMCAQLGFCPQLDECVLCGSPLGAQDCSFALAQGGLVCVDCSGEARSIVTRELAPEPIAWIKALLASRFVELEPLVGPECTALGCTLLLFFDEWVRAHLGFRLTSLDFLTQLR